MTAHIPEPIDNGALPSDRATQATPQAPAGLGHPVSVTSADGQRFTPGPWSVWEGGVVVHDDAIEGNVICLEPEHMMRASLASWPANARLIAAAPDMFEALEGARRSLRNWLLAVEMSDEAIAKGLEKIDAALAKARGQ